MKRYLQENCVYCAADFRHSCKLGDIFLTAPAKYTVYGDGAEYSMPMRYCPACGKKLKLGGTK